jgi:hypothetical protein
LDLTTTLCPFYLPPTPSPVIPSFPPSSFHLNPNNYAFSTLRISLRLPLPRILPFLPPFQLNPNIYAFPSYLPTTPSPVFPSFPPSFFSHEP